MCGLLKNYIMSSKFLSRNRKRFLSLLLLSKLSRIEIKSKYSNWILYFFLFIFLNERFFLFAHLHIYFTKLHYHTIYITILKLHTTYILAVLVAYNLYTLFILPTLQETNKQNKTNTEINMYH